MTATSHNPQSLFNVVFRKLLWVVFFLILLSSIFGFFGQFDWRLDLFAHFRLQYLLTFIVILALSLFLKMRVLILMSALFLVIQVLHFIPFYFPHKSVVDEGGYLVMMANVKKDNTEYSRLVTYVDSIKPDMLILAEVDPAWVKAVVSLKRDYPYEVSEVRDDYSGMMLMSRKPLMNARIERLGSRGLPTVSAEATVSGKLVTIMGTHPFPPFGARSDALRNDQLDAIGEYIAKQKTPVILVGDLNSSPFSYPYRLLLAKAPLRNCASGFGYQITWHARPFMPPFGLSIDQCLHTAGVTVLRSQVGEDIGSDHRPILNWFSQ